MMRMMKKKTRMMKKKTTMNRGGSTLAAVARIMIVERVLYAVSPGCRCSVGNQATTL
jgi:hypothetical protein